MRIESAIVSAARIATTPLSSETGSPETRAASSSSETAKQAAQQYGDRGERGEPERRDHDEVAARHGQDRAEEVLEQVHVERARRRDEHDACGDPGVEDDRERLVARRAAARAQPLDRDRADHGRDERGQHRRDAEQVADRDAREGDVADPVADQAHLALDEEEADGRREHAHDRAGDERQPHELELKHRGADV